MAASKYFMQRPVYPASAPLPEGTPQPFWSVMIPAYNRTKYLERTLRSVLDQAPGVEEMQIAVLDNASPGPEVEAMVREVGGERVEFVRQPINLGMVGNWNSCIQHARGHWVHILHDDDMVRPGFYAAYRQFIEAHPEVGLVFSRSLTIDENDRWVEIIASPSGQSDSGALPDALYKIVTENLGQFLRCPAVVVSQEAYQKLGGFQSDLVFAVDVEMWMRVAAAYPVGYLEMPLALYRLHSQRATHELMVREDLTKDISRTLNLGISQLPPAVRAEARREADKCCATYALIYRDLLHQKGQHKAAVLYAWRAYQFDRSRLKILFLAKSLSRLAKPNLIKKRQARRRGNRGEK